MIDRPAPRSRASADRPTGSRSTARARHGRAHGRLIAGLGTLVLATGGAVAVLERTTRPEPPAPPPTTTATVTTSSTGRTALPEFGPYPRFGASSVFGIDLTGAPLDPSGSPMVARLAKDVADNWGGVAALNVDKYGGAFAVADARTPRRDVLFSDCQDKGGPPAGVYTRAKHFAQVPIPADAVAAPGSDGHLAVWDPTQDKLWEFWVAEKRSDGRWQACWGGRIDNVSRSDGRFPVPFGSSATGLAAMGYLVTLEEARQARIEHAIGLVVMEAAPGHRWPANRDDGTSSNPLALQEGTRLRLDPALDVDALGLTPIGRAVAKAAQTYGFVVCDKGGAVAVMAETGDRWQGKLGVDPWVSLAAGSGTEAYQSLKGFPWDKLQVVQGDWGKPG